MDRLTPQPKRDPVGGEVTPFHLYKTEKLIKEAGDVLKETTFKVWFRHDFISAIVERLEAINAENASLQAQLSESQARERQLEAELAAAVADMEQIVGGEESCLFCRSSKNCFTPASCPQRNYTNWEWRGKEGQK